MLLFFSFFRTGDSSLCCAMYGHVMLPFIAEIPVTIHSLAVGITSGQSFLSLLFLTSPSPPTVSTVYAEELIVLTYAAIIYMCGS